MKADPRRSCIACRAERPKEELLRFVLSPERELVPDLKGRLPGRGAYICPTTVCLRRAVERRQFGRAFRQEPLPVTAQQLLELVRGRLDEKIAGAVSLANKAGQVVSGTDAVVAALKGGDANLLILSEDCAPATAERLLRAAAKGGVEVLTFFTRERLAALIGKEMRVAVAVRAGGLATILKDDIERHRNFGEGGVLDEQNPGS
jgi:hypothetical protein